MRKGNEANLTTALKVRFMFKRDSNFTFYKRQKSS